MYFITKQATLLRRSTVLSLPLQLVFPAHKYLNNFDACIVCRVVPYRVG